MLERPAQDFKFFQGIEYSAPYRFTFLFCLALTLLVAHKAYPEELDRAQISELQSSLQQLNLKPGPVDGVVGGQTLEAVKKAKLCLEIPDLCGDTEFKQAAMVGLVGSDAPSISLGFLAKIKELAQAKRKASSCKLDVAIAFNPAKGIGGTTRACVCDGIQLAILVCYNE